MRCGRSGSSNGVRFGDAVLWGYGQGGHAALWAGVIADGYAPEVALGGVAALAPLTDLVGVFGGASAGGPDRERAQAYLISSYAQAYPEVRFDSYVRPSAWLRVHETAARCQDAAAPLLDWLSPLEPGLAWARPATQGALGTRLATNRPDGPIPVPVLLAQGGGDQVITKDVQAGYVAEQCRRGTSLDYRIYGDRDHQSLVSASSPAIADLLAWTADRLRRPPVVQQLRLSGRSRCTGKGSRTPTPLRADGFEPSAYTIPPPRQGRHRFCHNLAVAVSRAVPSTQHSKG